MSFYTIDMVRKATLVTYENGIPVKTEQVEYPVRVVDMPWVTALAYKRAFPDNKVVLTPQAGAIDEARAEKRMKPLVEAIAEEYPAEFDRESAIIDAAISGDLAAAITEETEALS